MAGIYSVSWGKKPNLVGCISEISFGDFRNRYKIYLIMYKPCTSYIYVYSIYIERERERERGIK